MYENGRYISRSNYDLTLLYTDKIKDKSTWDTKNGDKCKQKMQTFCYTVRCLKIKRK
jgi:hypothetical protein